MTKQQPRIVRTYPQRKPKPPTLVQILIPAVALAAFIWLAITSEPYGHSYTDKERRSMDGLINRVSANGGKPAKYAGKAKRDAIMDLWNITEADVAAPVVLW